MIDGRGTAAGKTAFISGWPIGVASTAIVPLTSAGLPGAPVLADIDGDKIPEVLIGGIGGVVMAYDRTGVPAFGGNKSPYPPLSNMRGSYGATSNANNGGSIIALASTAVGDLDNDGSVDCVSASVGGEIASALLDPGLRGDFEHHIDAWDLRSGTFKPGFPRQIEDWVAVGHPAIADVSGDDKPEVIAGSGGYFVHAWDVTGTEAKSFPKFTGGAITTTPAVGDLDGDGKLELAVVTRDGYLHAWTTAGTPNGRIDWASFHHDDRNSGNFATAIGQGSSQQAQQAASGTSGCAYSLGGSRFAIMWLLLAVFFLRVWRRRGARSRQE